MSSSRTNALHPSVGQIDPATGIKGNDRLLLGIIMGVLAFWLFAQTTLNIAPDMQKDLALDTGLMNTAVAITALFSGIFIVFIGGLADRIGRMKIVMAGFVLSIIGSLLIGFARLEPLHHISCCPAVRCRACPAPASCRRAWLWLRPSGMAKRASAPSVYGRSVLGAVPASARFSAASSRRISAGDGSSSLRRSLAARHGPHERHAREQG